MAALQHALYGTSEPSAGKQRLTCGPLSLSVEANMLRSIRWHGVEMVRAVSYPIRDPDWGTMLLKSLEEALAPEAGTYLRRFETAGGAIDGELRLTASAKGRLDISVRFHAQRDVIVNRAGFTILHPVAGLAGTPLDITHADGSAEAGSFPELISPAQPARDIRALGYGIDGVRVDIEMAGDVFEMEDQRNWSDASYKTYCRPLSLPFPFRIAAGEEITQRLTLVFSGTGTGRAGDAARAASLELEGGTAQLPELLLAVEPGWELPESPASAVLAGSRRLVRLDLRSVNATQALRRCLAQTSRLYDLELITADDAGAMRAQLERLADDLDAFGRPPEHLIALPAAYLASYQPDGDWPVGATPAEAAAAAQATFPGVSIGGGMLTNFTELNRRRPDPAVIDYLSHGTTAIVHAADDQSVIETLEALPQIFRSARTLAAGKPYRLGLVSIGMRSNPYGAAVAPNPDRIRKAMAMEDPRHGALFGAAWLLAAVAATECEPVEAMALGAPAGPFGLVAPDGAAPWLRPCFHVFRALDAMRPRRRLRLRISDPAIHAVAVSRHGGIVLAAANLSAKDKTLVLPRSARTRCLDASSLPAAAADPNWLSQAPPVETDTIDLPPFTLAFAELDA